VPRRAAVVFPLALGLLSANSAAAQIPAPERPGPYAIDVRGVMMGVPQDPGFYPPLPANTLIPSRGFGIDLGGHVYLFNFGPSRVGVGANFVRVRGSASPPAPATSGSTPPTTPTTPTTPDVDVVITTFAPQLSVNFGSSLGWSYLSLGGGLGQVKTARSAFRTGAAQDRGSGVLSSANIGGGARWFSTPHLAFSFDLRWHLLATGKPTDVSRATPHTTVVTAAVGISIK
jgi:hypothetical protein